MIHYITKDGGKVGCTNHYKLTRMYPGLAIESCDVWVFEGFLLNFEWHG